MSASGAAGWRPRWQYGRCCRNYSIQTPAGWSMPRTTIFQVSTVDRYGPYLVMQVGTLAIDQRKTKLAALLLELTGCAGVLERSEMAVRHQEGLSPASGLLAGNVPVGPIQIEENGLRFWVDLVHGQKTGFYNDQRGNRPAGRSLLPCAQRAQCFQLHGGVRRLCAGSTGNFCNEPGQQRRRPAIGRGKPTPQWF